MRILFTIGGNLCSSLLARSRYDVKLLFGNYQFGKYTTPATPNMDSGSDSDDAIASTLMFSLYSAAVAGALVVQRRRGHAKYGENFGVSRIGKAMNRDGHRNRFEGQTSQDWFCSAMVQRTGLFSGPKSFVARIVCQRKYKSAFAPCYPRCVHGFHRILMQSANVERPRTRSACSPACARE